VHRIILMGAFSNAIGRRVIFQLVVAFVLQRRLILAALTLVGRFLLAIVLLEYNHKIFRFTAIIVAGANVEVHLFL